MKQQSIYICDGSVEGLLSSIYQVYYGEDNVYDIISDGSFQSDFTFDYKNIATDYNHAQKVAYAIKTKISKLAFENIINTWLSETPKCGHHIIEYIKLGFNMGYKVNYMLTQDNVSFVQKMNQKVAFENHRFLGILRFSKMSDGTFFSRIKPDHNILPLMAEHFACRLATEKLIIYDEKRNNAVLSDMGEWIIVNNIQINEQELSTDELEFRQMWQRYFEAIAIKERTNKKLQRSFIPIRYWANVTELKKELK